MLCPGIQKRPRVIIEFSNTVNVDRNVLTCCSNRWLLAFYQFGLSLYSARRQNLRLIILLLDFAKGFCIQSSQSRLWRERSAAGMETVGCLGLWYCLGGSFLAAQIDRCVTPADNLRGRLVRRWSTSSMAKLF